MSSSVRVIFRPATLQYPPPALTFLWPDHALVFVIIPTSPSRLKCSLILRSSVRTLQIRFVLFVCSLTYGLFEICDILSLLAHKLRAPVTTTPLTLTTTLLLSVSCIRLIHG